MTFEASEALGLAIADEATIVLIRPEQTGADVLDEDNIVYFHDRSRANMELGTYLEVIKLLGALAGKDTGDEIDETRFRKDLTHILSSVAEGGGGISEELALECGITDTTPWYLK